MKWDQLEFVRRYFLLSYGLFLPEVGAVKSLLSISSSIDAQTGAAVAAKSERPSGLPPVVAVVVFDSATGRAAVVIVSWREEFGIVSESSSDLTLVLQRNFSSWGWVKSCQSVAVVRCGSSVCANSSAGVPQIKPVSVRAC